MGFLILWQILNAQHKINKSKPINCYSYGTNRRQRTAAPVQGCCHPGAGLHPYYQKIQEKLYWHIRRMVVDHEDANDVLQNMFIKVWNALENFREDSQLYTWLYRIATNESLTFLEQQKRERLFPLMAVWKPDFPIPSRRISILMPTGWSGSFSWPYSSCLKNKELCLT